MVALDRRNTNFPTQLKDALMACYNSSDQKEVLRYYQILVGCYLKMNISKGLYLWHHMGMGKTLGAYHIMYEVMNTLDYKKALVIAPRALVNNFKESQIKYEELTKNKLNRENIHFVKLSHTTEKQIAEIDPDSEIDPFGMEKKAKKLERLKNLNGFLIFIEEAHLMLRKISHGSESMIRLYDLMMTSDCKIVMLSGSLIAASPMELAAAFNLLAGEKIFPEIEEEFYNAFFDYNTRTIKNKFHFQDRIFGLVSRMKPEYLGKQDKSLYPTILPEQKIDIPMSRDQYSNYLRVREKEIEEEIKSDNRRKARNVQKFQSTDSVMGSFRVRSRQYCNFIPSASIEKYYKDGDYDQNMLVEEIYKMDKKDASSPKAEYFLKEIYPAYTKRKGLLYSQFVGVSGSASIAHYLSLHGWRELMPNLTLSDYHKDSTEEDRETGGIFARVNGSLSQEEQSNIVDYYKKEENNDGRLINIMIIGIEQCMGLDLNSVAYIVMFEPYWVYFLKDQLEHRGNRFKSHITLPKPLQNMTMYILTIEYPKNVNVDDFDSAKMRLTTDQHVYKKMMENKKTLSSFKEPIEEVSIESLIINQFNPDAEVNCRTCIPDDKPLYTSDENFRKALKLDLESPSPCQSGEKEDIAVEEIIVDLNGEKTKYYYTKSDSNIYGYVIYIEVSPDNFEEVPTKSPVYKKILEIIRNQ